MGVELRSIQRKFKNFMGDVNPQIRPRFVVWLDERLAEFKIRGQMDLSETLDDPQWIKDFNTSKRQAKATAIREQRSAGTSITPLVKPKDETRSESSNGLAHAEEETQPDDGQSLDESKVGETELQAQVESQGFHLVEVKKEQIEEDDDMIIVGETHAPPKPTQAIAYSSSYSTSSPTGYVSTSYGRTLPTFQRKRQRFGTTSTAVAFPHRYGSSRYRTTPRYKQNFRAMPSHSATSSQPTFPRQTIAYTTTDDPSQHQSVTQTYHGQEETLRIPPHLQAQAGMGMTDEGGGGVEYSMDEGMMYGAGGEEYEDESSYLDESSYMTEGGGEQSAESSLVQYETDPTVIKGEGGQGDESSMNQPVAGTSTGDASFQDHVSQQSYWDAGELHLIETPSGLRYKCPFCPSTFTDYSNTRRHFLYKHLNIVKYRCPTCSLTFIIKENMTAHMNAVHLNIRPYSCPCGSSFLRKHECNKHIARCPYK